MEKQHAYMQHGQPMPEPVQEEQNVQAEDDQPGQMPGAGIDEDGSAATEVDEDK